MTSEATQQFPDEYYVMGRDPDGDVRANSGHGLVIARADDSADTVRGWAERADSDHRRRLYEAAAEFIDTTPKPPRIQLADLLGETEGFLVGERCASAVIAAGWRPPARVIETVEEADQVRRGTVVRTETGWIAECTGAPCWVLVGDKSPTRTSALDLPLTVLFEPEAVSE